LKVAVPVSAIIDVKEMFPFSGVEGKVKIGVPVMEVVEPKVIFAYPLTNLPFFT